MLSDDAAWIALHSLYYQAEWQRFGLTNPATLSPAYRPLSLVDATNALVAYTNDRQARPFRELAIAEIARSRDLLPASQVHDALVALATANIWNSTQIHDLLFSVLPRPIPNDRFQQALTVYLPEMVTFAGFDLKASFCVPALVSQVLVRVTIPHPSDEISPYADPRQWSTLYPAIWRKSEAVPAPANLDDRDDDPAAPGPTLAPPTGSFQSPLLECIGWIGEGSVLSNTLFDIRNVLDVQFQQLPDRSRLDYANRECLSTELPVSLGSRRQGGIDHDSGFAEIGPAGQERSSVTICKSLRFTQPKSDLLVTNEVAFINTILLLESMALFGAVMAGGGLTL